MEHQVKDLNDDIKTIIKGLIMSKHTLKNTMFPAGPARGGLLSESSGWGHRDGRWDSARLLPPLTVRRSHWQPRPPSPCPGPGPSQPELHRDTVKARQAGSPANGSGPGPPSQACWLQVRQAQDHDSLEAQSLAMARSMALAPRHRRYYRTWSVTSQPGQWLRLSGRARHRCQWLRLNLGSPSVPSDPLYLFKRITRDVRHRRDSLRGKLHCNSHVSLQSGHACRKAHYDTSHWRSLLARRAPWRPACESESHWPGKRPVAESAVARAARAWGW